MLFFLGCIPPQESLVPSTTEQIWMLDLCILNSCARPCLAWLFSLFLFATPSNLFPVASYEVYRYESSSQEMQSKCIFQTVELLF